MGAPRGDELRGIGILVTRPRHQAGTLCSLIERRGGKAIAFPVMEILEPDDIQELQQAIVELDNYDWAIFISANAVNKALDRILEQRSWPKNVRIAVIGKKSAEELSGYGLLADAFPEQKFNSEALLALPEMQDVDGLRVAIFRGDGGREYLAEVLRARGAEVNYVEAYRRACPQVDGDELLDHLHNGAVDVVLVNSVESLENLVKLAGERGRDALLKMPLIVASERIEPVADALGFEQAPLVAENATDEAVLAALLAWAKSPERLRAL